MRGVGRVHVHHGDTGTGRLVGDEPAEIATALLAWTGRWWAVAVYLAVLTTITLIALAFGPETRGQDIVTVSAAENEPAGRVTG
ncbi:hypothetical protein [Streptosporangium sp. NPDC002607]